MKELALFAVGGLCVALPILNGTDWPMAAIAAYGGALSMMGAMGVTGR